MKTSCGMNMNLGQFNTYKSLTFAQRTPTTLRNSYKSVCNSIILIFLFIIPYTISANLNTQALNVLYLVLLILYSALTVFLYKDLLKKEYSTALKFALIFMVFGVFNQLINNYVSYFNILAPFIAYLGYVFTIKYKFDFKVFNILIISNYIYFIIVYFSNIPLDLLRPDTEIDGDFFRNTSSNLIPCVLIINLYAYDIISKIKNNGRNDKIILLYATLNVGFILMQKSRAGIVVAIVYFLMKLFQAYRKWFWVFLLLFIFLFLSYSNLINLYLDSAGGMTSYSDYSQDARGLALTIFFNNLDFKSFFFGFGKDIFGLGQIFGTQALFLNIWNYYGIFVLLAIIVIIIKRFIIKNKNMISSIYLIPFLLYSFFEGFFLSSFWDFFLYLILFYKKPGWPPPVRWGILDGYPGKKNEINGDAPMKRARSCPPPCALI